MFIFWLWMHIKRQDKPMVTKKQTWSWNCKYTTARQFVEFFVLKWSV